MEEWNVVQCGYNTADETINFGTRALAGDGNLFEACTLATVTSEQKQSGGLNGILSCIRSEKVFYAINRTAGVFSNLSCNELCFSTIFEATVNTLCVTQDAKYAIFGLQDGTIHCIDIEEQSTIFEENLLGICENVYIDSYILSYSDDLSTLIVITDNGDVYRLRCNERMELTSKEVIVKLNFKINSSKLNYPYLLVNGSRMCLCNLETQEEIEDYSENIRKIIIYNENMFLLLHNEGHLIGLCNKTLLQINIPHTQSFKDIIFLKNQDRDKCLLIVVTNPDETGSSYLQSFVSLADFENPIFSLKWTDAIHLIEPENMNEDYMFISERKSEGVTTEIRFQVLCETVPEQRLQKLFKRHKFEEAEKFAKLFNLDRGEIVKGRAVAITNQIHCTSEDVDKFLQLLDSVDDVAFKLQCCVDMYSCCSELDDVKRILQYACCELVIDSTDNVELETLLESYLFKLETFTLLQRYDDDMDWHLFMNQDLIELFYTVLRKRNIEMATIIYNRLDSEIKVEYIEKALKIIDTFPIECHAPILHSLVPISLAKLPESVSTFVLWLKEKIFSIEKTDYAEFPQNAIDFTNSIVKLLECDNSNLFSGRTVTDTSCRKSAEELSALMDALKRIKLLRETYHIAIPLKEYLKGSKAFIHLLLVNIKFSEESFHIFFDDFLCDFMLSNYYLPDDILLEEIQDIVKHQEIYWTNIPRFLRHISSVEKKLTAIHTVATTAAIPWSQYVRDITAGALVYKHPLVELIVKVIESEPLHAVLKKVPYGLHTNVNPDDWERWIKRIIYCNLPSMVEDVYTLCIEQEKRQFAHVMLFHNFVKKNRKVDAMEIVKNIPAEELTDFCKQITLFITQSNYRNIENYPSILQSLEQYWKNSGVKSAHDVSLQQQFKSILSFFAIKAKLLPTISYMDLQRPSKRDEIYDKLLTKALGDFKSNGDLTALYNTLQQIAKCFDIPKEEAMVKFVAKCKNFEAINYCAEHFYLNETNAKTLSSLALSIIYNIPSASSLLPNFDLTNEASIMENSLTDVLPNDASTYFAGVNLALKLVTKALLNSENDLYAIGHVYDWISHFFYFTCGTSEIQRKLFPNTFTSEGTTPSIHTFCAVKSILEVYISYTRRQGVDNMNTSCVISATTSPTDPKLLNQITKTIYQLHCEGHLLVAYEAVTFLQNRLCQIPNMDNSVKDALKQLLIKKCSPPLLQKVFAAKVIDNQLAQRLLLSYDDTTAGAQIQAILKQYIEMYRRNAPKLNVIVHLAIKMFNHHGHNTPNTYSTILLLSKWYMKIENCQVLIKTFYTASTTDLLELLILHKHLDLSNIAEYCNDFNIDLQLSYNVYLKKLITTWKPEYKIVKTREGTSKLIMKTSENDLLEECKKVFVLINSKEYTQKYLDKIASMINFYHYEPFVCVYKLFSWINKNTDITAKLQLLGFLQLYVRVKEPAEREVEEWYTLYPDSQGIDPLSQWRLPFTPTFFTHDIWTIIRPEINLSTYTTWFNAVPFLNKALNRNDICSYVIKEVVSSNILKKNVGTNWVPHAVHERLFEDVDRCIQNISNLELATSVMYHLMINVPEGADQVNAAKLCLKYAVEYKKRSNSTDHEMTSAFKKIHKKYLKFSVMHILRLCLLDIEQYSEFLLQPDELINALYRDKWIIKKFDAVALNCPDINKAVHEIGILFDIDVEEKLKALLEGYLLQISNNPDANDLDDELISVNLKRAAYICQSGDLLHWQKFLLNIGMEDSIHSAYYRANALKCLTLISEVDSIETMVDLPYNAFINYIEKMYLLGDLELRGHSLSIDQLNKYSKMKFLRRLSANIDNPAIVKIMGNLCIVYSIYDVKYWEIIIDASIKLNLYRNMKKYVHFWSLVDNSKYKKFYIKAWQYLVDNALNAGTGDRDIFYQCVKNIQMIQTCPVLFSLKFVNVFNTFCQLGKVEFAAIVVQYMPAEDHVKHISEIIDISFKVPDLSPLQKYGIWGIEKVQQLFTGNGN